MDLQGCLAASRSRSLSDELVFCRPNKYKPWTKPEHASPREAGLYGGRPVGHPAVSHLKVMPVSCLPPAQLPPALLAHGTTCGRRLRLCALPSLLPAGASLRGERPRGGCDDAEQRSLVCHPQCCPLLPPSRRSPPPPLPRPSFSNDPGPARVAIAVAQEERRNSETVCTLPDDAHRAKRSEQLRRKPVVRWYGLRFEMCTRGYLYKSLDDARCPRSITNLRARDRGGLRQETLAPESKPGANEASK